MRSDAERRRRERTAALCVSLFAAFALLPALANGFVWDDVNNLVASDRLRSPSALFEVFRQPAMWSAGNEAINDWTYRPLALASFALDFQLHGGSPVGFHGTSIVLHAGCMAALALLLVRTAGLWIGGAAAALCAIHPSVVESVVWVNGRSEPLAALFGLLAWLALLSTGRARLPVAGILLFLALLGKEAGIAFAILAPFVRPCLAAAAGDSRVTSSPSLPRPELPALGTAIAAVLAYTALRAGAVAHVVGPASIWTDGERWLLAPVFAGRLLEGVILPLRLGVSVVGADAAELGPGALISWGVGVSGLLLLLAMALRARRLPAAFGIAWWFATIAAPAMLISSDWPGMNRWLYLGMGGLALATADLAAYASRRAMENSDARPHEWLRRASLPGALVGLLAFVQLQRGIAVWRSDISLFARTVAEAPEQPHGHAHLGMALLHAGAFSQAAAPLLEAERLGYLAPGLPEALAFALATTGRCDEALTRLPYASAPATPGFAAMAEEARRICAGPGRVTPAGREE